MDRDDRSATGGFGMTVERLEAFSDAVMAVIITITAFQIRVPGGPTLHALRHALPGLFVYALSFTFIAIYWNNHHHLLRAARRISAGVMWANMNLLFWLSLIPFLTRWLSEWYRHSLPAASYGVVALVAGASYTILVRALIRANGHDSALATAISSDAKGYASLALYAAGAVLSFVSPWIAYALYVAPAIIWIVPDPRLTR